jgi:TRAP-type mannitol/chloroaromatic compound transport system substrate-binding protein
MKRREFLKAAGAGITASAVAAPAIAQSMPELRWRLTASWPKSLDTLYGAADYMSKRIAELSDNKFHIQVFAAGEIVPGLQVLDAVQNGTVEMGHTASYYYFGKDPAFTFGTALPFGLNTRQQEAWQFHGGAWSCSTISSRPTTAGACRPATRRARWAAGSVGKSRTSMT